MTTSTDPLRLVCVVGARPNFMKIAPMGPAGYGVLTLHRPSNVDGATILLRLIAVLREIGRDLPLVFAVYPRTEARLRDFGFLEAAGQGLVLVPPLPYFELLLLVAGARLALTDSGGLQEETTALGVPCLTLRANTERPITVDEGTNTVVGTDTGAILAAVQDIREGRGKRGPIPGLWDGHAAERIRDEILAWRDSGGGR